jgi:hypothetical protein
VVGVIACGSLTASRVTAAEVVGRERILPPERQRADGVFRKTDIRLSAEQGAALAERTVTAVKTVFENEKGFQAAAEVFVAAKAPTAARCDAIVVLDE